MGASWAGHKPKNCLEVSSSLILGNSNKLFLDQIMKCDEKQILIHQPVSTSSIARLRRSSKALLKAKLALKKGSWSPFGGLLPIWSTTAFWISAKPLHLRSMLSKLMRCTRKCNTAASIGQQKGLNSPRQWLTTRHTTNTSKVELIWSFASSAIFSWPLANRLPLLQASRQPFAGENASTSSRRWKRLSKNLSIPKAQIFMLQE